MESSKYGEKAKKWWLCCSGWIMRDSDSEEDVRIKRTVTPLALFSLPLSSYQLVYGMLDLDNATYATSMAIFLTSYSIYFVGGILGKNMGTVIDASLLLLAIGNVVYDAYNTAALEQRNWSLIVVYLDFALVLDRMRPVRAMIIVTITWLFVANIESAFRFGLYDEINSAPPPVCDCLHPPCRTSFVGNSAAWIVGSIVMLFDFYLTRGFATNLRLQLRRVKSSVDVAAQVAAALAMYDVDEAEKAIENGKDLPQELAGSYRRLLSNLRSYRDYLPEELLHHGDDENHRIGSAVRPPLPEGGKELRVGMVFTDIQSSTALWDSCPQEMHKALHMHNAILRDLANAYAGYEVKIIGDALMLAFGSAMNAVMFGIHAQTRLVQGEWPTGLCEQPLCIPVDGPHGVPLWNGVRVRIGINWGAVEAEMNPVTGRYDYFGPAVNIASRVEATLKHGGLTGITQAVLDEIGYEVLAQDMFITLIGERDLKGLTRPVTIHVILPFELAERWELVTTGGLLDLPLCDESVSSPKVMSSPTSPFATPSRSYSHSLSRSRRSRSSASDSSQHTPALNLRLVTTTSTSVAVRGSFHDAGEEVATAWTQLLVATETAALRTGGQVVCVLSSVCLLAWNAGTPCVQHISQAEHSVSLLRIPAFSGMAVGRVLSGNISGTRRRHVVVAGASVDLSVTLSEAAAFRRLPYLAASDAGSYLGSRGLAVKLALWMETGGGKIEVWGPKELPGGFPELKPAATEEAWKSELEVERTFTSSFPERGLTGSQRQTPTTSFPELAPTPPSTTSFPSCTL
eukprot:Hpha_TRINITY_DN15504_c0_g2::TRINITY_DN15504_c0_g2_i2::g.107059::m.107059